MTYPWSEKYPWHVKDVPCLNIANCLDEKGHEMCHNCNPQYVKRDPCDECGLKADGGRRMCCMVPVCHGCYAKTTTCPRCANKKGGYFRCFEEPENAAALIAAAAANKTEPAAESSKPDVDKLMGFVNQAKDLKREHAKAVENLVYTLADPPVTRDERIRVLKKLVFERMATSVIDEMSNDDNTVYDNDFDKWVTFDEDKLTANIDGEMFRFCLLPCKVVDALSADETYDIEPPKKKHKK
jgi:hypothetical protein